jgi:hypothetical protein
MGLFHALWDWLSENTWTVFGISLAIFLGTLVALPVVVALLPADYFIRKQSRWPTSVWGWLLHVVKNLLGIIFLTMGIAMLVLPGQGLLTMLIGIMLLDFPGKRGWEFWLIRRHTLRKSIDWIRKKAGREPLNYGNHIPAHDA